MRAKTSFILLGLACAGPAFAQDAASAAVSTPTMAASLDNTYCDAYHGSVLAIRSPKDLGTVNLRFEISPQGEVVSSEIGEYTTSRYFAHVVQENFSKCHFRPALQDGVPVPGHGVRLRLVFGNGVRTANNATCPPPASRETPPAAGPMAVTKLRVRFLATGRVASVDVLESSGVPALDEAAVTSLRQCHFDPAASGQPAFQEEWVTSLNWSK
jgi:TonB family protein